MEPLSPPDQSQRSVRPWTVCFLLFLATALNYLDRQTLGIAAPLIQRELKLDNAQVGLLLSVFFYTYGIMQAFVGPILDCVDIRLGYAAAVGWWSISGGLTGLVHGFWQLISCRMMLGVGEAANWPAALRITARIFPAEKRSLANGFFNSGASVGAIVAPPLIIWLSTRWNWRQGFLAIGLAGACWIIAWLAFSRSLPLEVPSVVRRKGKITNSSSTSSKWGTIVRSRPFWGLVVASTFANPCYYFYATWLPTYFVADRGFSFGMKLGGSLTVPLLGFGIGNVIGGVPVVLLTKRGFGVAKSRKLVIAVATALMLSAVSVPWITGTTGVLALIFLMALSMGSWQANYVSFVQDVSPEHVATVSGVIGSAGAFSGGLFIWLAGVISKGTHGFSPVFTALAIMPVIASVGIFWSFREDD